MEVVRRVVLCCCCVLGFAATCEADGFFRRLPEVGEWARYDFELKVGTHSKEGAADLEGAASGGSLTLKCVGEEVIDDVPHLWLETRFDVTDFEGGEHWAISKVLVPADQVVEGEITSHIVRGWSAGDTEEPRALILGDGKFEQEPSAFNLMLAFPEVRISAGRRAARTVMVAGEEIDLVHCETGDLPRFEFDTTAMMGEATWWPSADHAFGIAAAQLKWTSISMDQADAYLYTATMDLVEYGSEAETDLPDNN